MPSVVVREGEPSVAELNVAAAKIRALDAYLASEEYEEFDASALQWRNKLTEWEIKFIMDAKDWVDKKFRRLTLRQYESVIKIWEKVEGYYYSDLDYDAFYQTTYKEQTS